MIKEAIKIIIEGKNLKEKEAIEVMNEIMSGNATDAQIGAFITVLRIKGESLDEITGCARVMREKALRVKISPDIGEIVDTCGTGGDGSNTFNISTAAAFVVAGAGLKVAKHGNKSVSSQCGSADVLQEMGINIQLSPDKVAESIKNVGIGFIFAPLFHGAMKYAIGPRKEIGIRTIFNILGPLTNPAYATAQVLGVYDGRLTTVMAHVLMNMGIRRAFVVHGTDGIDEITITGNTRISELKEGRVRTYNINPDKFGLKKARISSIRGGTAGDNAKIILSVLKGEKGPRRDVVLLNSAAAIIAGNKARIFKEGIKLAGESIDSGNALKKFQQMKEFSNK